MSCVKFLSSHDIPRVQRIGESGWAIIPCNQVADPIGAVRMVHIAKNLPDMHCGSYLTGHWIPVPLEQPAGQLRSGIDHPNSPIGSASTPLALIPRRIALRLGVDTVSMAVVGNLSQYT